MAVEKRGSTTGMKRSGQSQADGAPGFAMMRAAEPMKNDQDSATNDQATARTGTTETEASEGSAVEAGWDVEETPAEPAAAVPAAKALEAPIAAEAPTAPALAPVVAAPVEAPVVAAPAVDRVRRVIDMRRPRAAPPPQPEIARQPPPSFERRPRREERERPAPAVVPPREHLERPSSPRQVDSPPAPWVAPAPRAARIERGAPHVAVVAAPAPAPPAPAKEPAWIPPMGVDRRRKKKPALTAKEAMVAKVQAQAARKPAKPAPAAREIEERSRDNASEPSETKPAASKPSATSPAASRSAVAKVTPKRSGSKRGVAKAPPPQEEEVLVLPVKRGFFSRLLDVFRGTPKAKDG